MFSRPAYVPSFDPVAERLARAPPIMRRPDRFDIEQMEKDAEIDRLRRAQRHQEEEARRLMEEARRTAEALRRLEMSQG